MSYQNQRETNPFEIWTAYLPNRKDSKLKCGCRPVIIVSEESYEKLDYVSVVPLTRDLATQQLPTHVLLCNRFLDLPSRALCEQVTTVEKDRLIRRIGYVDEAFDRFALRRAMATHLSLMNVQGSIAAEESIYAMLAEV